MPPFNSHVIESIIAVELNWYVDVDIQVGVVEPTMIAPTKGKYTVWVSAARALPHRPTAVLLSEAVYTINLPMPETALRHH